MAMTCLLSSGLGAGDIVTGSVRDALLYLLYFTHGFDLCCSWPGKHIGGHLVLGGSRIRDDMPIHADMSGLSYRRLLSHRPINDFQHLSRKA
jgi:hypothetical protein